MTLANWYTSIESNNSRKWKIVKSRSDTWRPWTVIAPGEYITETYDTWWECVGYVVHALWLERERLASDPYTDPMYGGKDLERHSHA